MAIPNRTLICCAVEIGAEFEIVPAAGHGDRVRSLIVVLISVLRTGDRISERCVAADDQIGNALVQSQRGLVIETEAAAGSVIGGLAVQKHIAEERGAEGLHGLRRNEMDSESGDRVGDDVVGNRKPGHARAGDGQRIELVQARCGIAQEQLILAVVEVVIQAEAALIVVVDPELGGFKNVGRRYWAADTVAPP